MNNGSVKLIIIGIILLILIVGGYLFIQGNQAEVTNANVQEGQVMKDKRAEDVMRKDSVVEMVMNDTNALTGQLEDVSSGNGEGTAYLLRKAGILYHYVEASLPALDTDLAYEGWLVSKSPSLRFFSTGVMKKTNDKYTLSYTTDSEYIGYDDVVITLETKIDDTPEDHILEGIVE